MLCAQDYRRYRHQDGRAGDHQTGAAGSTRLRYPGVDGSEGVAAGIGPDLLRHAI